ncbi:hypothetical protein LJR030_000811 [Rhizobium sp. LjRoot30]|uniref:hypothetical protein n=1 Tax=Rhizobium sp. LjRoot30 TaxID=3342320 RepID=UPI003ED170FF
MVGVELPALKVANGSEPTLLPDHYREWKQKWEVARNATQKQNERATEAEMVSETLQDIPVPMSPSVRKFAERYEKLVSSPRLFEQHFKANREFLKKAGISPFTESGADDDQKDDRE